MNIFYGFYYSFIVCIFTSSHIKKLSYHSIVGKYERDEVKTTIDVVMRLAEVLATTVRYLHGKTDDKELFKDPAMLKRLNDITHLPEFDKEHILYTKAHLLAFIKTRLTYA